MSPHEFTTTDEAARLIGVSTQQVRRLVNRGELTRVARGLVDRSSIESYLHRREGGRTRVWAEHTAWAAIALLSGASPDWLGATQLSRLRTALRGMTNSAELVIRTRDRARVTAWSAHPSAIGLLRRELVIADRQSLGLVPRTIDDFVDGYLDGARLDGIASTYGLLTDPGGQVTIRTTSVAMAEVRRLAEGPGVLAALDAATAIDPRERGVGERALTEALERFER